MFEKFIRKEMSRFISNFSYKLEIEKMFVNGINSDNFYNIVDASNGIISNLFDREANIVSHISINKFNKINKITSSTYVYEIITIIEKKQMVGSTYDITFKTNLPKKGTESDDDISNELIYKVGGSSDKIMYKINDPIFDNLNRKKNKSKKLDLFNVKILNIEENKLIENIFFSYILTIFKYILPNLHYNYIGIKQINDMVIEFESLKLINKSLYDSMLILFFINIDTDMYSKIFLSLKDMKENTPNKFNEIIFTFSKKKLTYI